MARQHEGKTVISEVHKDVVNMRTASAASKCNAQPLTLFVFIFLFG